MGKKLYGKMAAWQTLNRNNSAKLSKATGAAAAASRNALSRAKKNFAAKMSMLTNVIAANAKRAQRDTERLTGVAFNIAKANAKDRANIRDQTRAMQADMNKAIVQAVDNGVALGKAIQQRLKGNLKAAVRSLRVELAEQLDRSADLVLKTVTGKRHKIADNYLSLKAYAVAAADKVIDYTARARARTSPPSETCCAQSVLWELSRHQRPKVLAWVVTRSALSSLERTSRSATRSLL